jgi:hypothetical protein
MGTNRRCVSRRRGWPGQGSAFCGIPATTLLFLAVPKELHLRAGGHVDVLNDARTGESPDLAVLHEFVAVDAVELERGCHWGGES